MPPKPSDDYGHGQMMGMLVVIQLFENARDAGTTINEKVLENIKKIAAGDLAGYLDKPEEDVYLLVETQLKEIK